MFAAMSCESNSTNDQSFQAQNDDIYKNEAIKSNGGDFYLCGHKIKGSLISWSMSHIWMSMCTSREKAL